MRQPPPGTVHWTVRSNYLLRGASFLAMFVVVQLHGRTVGFSPAWQAFLVLHLLAYPHLAYVLAARATDSKRAELRNLVVDSALFGFMCALLAFPLAISVCVYIASTLNLVINQGARGVLRSQLAFGSGALVGGTLAGWSWSPGATAWVTGLCLLANVLYMIGIGMTANRRNQRLRQVRQALSERTDELTQALSRLQKAQAELLEAEKLAALGQLVAGVAHELNTPIGNAVSAASALQEAGDRLAQRLADGSMKRSDLAHHVAQSQEMAALIVRACDRAASLIASFKQVADDHRDEQARDFDLREVVDDHLATLAPSLRQAGVTLRQRVPTGIACHGHAGTVGQVISSLVHNAYTHAFGPQDTGVVTVEARVEAGRAVVTVVDNGRGMAPDVLKHVFDPFFTTRMGQGQNGLGLTICHNLATAVLGGSLHAESREGEGSTFRLEFPLRGTQARAVSSAPP